MDDPPSRCAATSSALRNALLRELDRLLDESSAGRVRLDDVFRELARRDGPVTTESLREAAEGLTGASFESFFARPELAPPRAS